MELSNLLVGTLIAGAVTFFIYFLSSRQDKQKVNVERVTIINEFDHKETESEQIDEAVASDWLKRHNSLYRENDFSESLAARSAREYREEQKRLLDEASLQQLENDRLVSIKVAEQERWRAMTKQEQIEVWLEQRERPGAHPLGISPRGAELLIGQWLSYLGEENVEVTKATGDGGVDVITKNFCCQVKLYQKQTVTSSEIRDLYGTAHAMSLTPVIFTSSDLTSDAHVWALQNGVLAIKFSPEESTLCGLNALGQSFLDSGYYQ
jgi:hypothetical protein